MKGRQVILKRKCQVVQATKSVFFFFFVRRLQIVLSVILLVLVYCFLSFTRVSIYFIDFPPHTHSLLDVKQTQPFHQLQRFWEPTKQCHSSHHTNTQTELELHKQSSNDLGGRVWSEKPGSERSSSSLNFPAFPSFLLSFTNTLMVFLAHKQSKSWNCEQLREKSTGNTLFQSVMFWVDFLWSAFAVFLGILWWIP